MSYYSQVGLCLEKKSFNELKKRLEKYDYMLKDGFCTITVFDDVVVCNWDCIKWYDFDEINIIKNFLSELSEQEIDYSLVRIGEEYEDVETQSCYNKGVCDRIGVYRGIDIY